MYLQDIRIDDICSLNATATQSLSRGLTVLAGESSARLKEWLDGVADLLGNLQSAEARFQSSVLPLQSEVRRRAAAVAGELRIYSKTRQYLLRQMPGSGVDLFRADSPEQVVAAADASGLVPRWLQSEDLSHFCTAEAVEADDLRMLARLVSAGESAYGSARELERAHTALLQVLADRDGNGLEGGVVHRISELRRQQGELQRRISVLRDTGAEARKRTAEIRKQLVSCETQLADLAERSAGLVAEQERLQQSVADSVSVTVESPTGMLPRWQKMRAAAAADLESLRTVGGACLMLSGRSLSAMRESILRMEERFQRLAEAGHAGGLNEADVGLAGSSLQQVRQEVASLNHQLADYEQQLEQQQPDGPLPGLIATAVEAIDAVLAALGESGTAAGDQPAATVVGTGSATAAARQLRQLDEERNQLEDQSQRLRLLIAELSDALRSPAPVVLSSQALEQLDLLQAEFAALDAEVLRLEQQRRQLDGAERRLREAIEHLSVTRGVSVLGTASAFLQRLCPAVFRGVRLEQNELFVLPDVVSPASPVRMLSLPRHQRIVVCLAVRLALLRVCGTAEGLVPLLLTDELLRQAPRSTDALVDVVRESVDQGLQVLWLVEDSLVHVLGDLSQVEIRRLLQATETREPQTAQPRLVLHTVESVEVVESPTVTAQPAPQTSPTPVTAEISAVEAVASLSGGANWLFYLELHHGVEDLAGISLAELEALRAARFVRVADLLERTVPELEESIRHRGFIVPVERLQALRGQAELATRVPMLRRGDAALLFAAGITSADELRKLRPEAVYEKVTAFQRSEAGARWRRSGRLIDRQQALNWARFGQFSRTSEELQAARTQLRQVAAAAATATGAGGWGAGSRAVVPQSGSSAAAIADQAPEMPAETPVEASTSGSRVIVTRRRRQLPAEPASGARRARRVARREQLAAQLKVDPQPATSEIGQPVERIGGMRFFLSRTSDVVQAPSIGPKTAEILHGAGVRTIEELLNVPAERIAEKLNQKRLTVEVVRRWQVQAQLVCRIPELRGHDAQILAACGISTPEALASRTPAELLAAMKPFLESAEGRRVLRSQSGPDLEEVTEWIQWAANARPLRAA
jgi:predicted  nucleic acid-binding Zn-ribbon protein